jgi:hypothetical protein
MRSFVQRNPFLTFALLTLGFQFAIVLVVWFFLPPGKHLHDDETLHAVFRLRAFGPLAFALLVTFYLEGVEGANKLFSSYFHWKVPIRWYALSVTWKFMLAWTGIGFVVLLTDAAWPGWFAENFWHNYLLNLPFIFGIAFVEETSWIRFSITRMQMRYSAFWSAFIVGNCWGLWYLPMILIGEGVPPDYPVLVFHACMLSLTILLVWVYNTTRSGLVLLIMQVLSNTVFMMVDVLPGGEVKADGTLELRYVIGYSYVFVLMSILLVVIFGKRNLSRNQRVRWDDEGHEPVPASPELEGVPVTIAYVERQRQEADVADDRPVGSVA